MTLAINEIVRLLEDVHLEGICSGSLGVIVAVFSEPEEAYEVEFCDEKGATTAQVALKPSQFEAMT